MARNAIESDFRLSNMAAGSYFVKKNKKLCAYLKWREMRWKVIFGYPKWPPAAILWKKNAIESDFRSSKMLKMATGSHFVNQI